MVWNCRKNQSPSTAGHLVVTARSKTRAHRWIEAKSAEVTLTPIGTVSTGAFDEGGSEIVAHDPIRQHVFSVNAKAGTVDVIDIADPTAPRKIGSLATPGANSVAVQGNLALHR
ncbi:hypothetical protein ACQP1U_04340 [Actinomycetota bacterium]